MQEIFANFYKRFGVLHAQQLISPRVFDKELFHFPKSSLFHFSSHTEEQVTPDPLASYFKAAASQILIDHITDMTSKLGAPRRLTVTALDLFRPFHQKYRAFKYLKNPQDTIKTPSVLEVINYGFLQKTYVYNNLPINTYNKWFNIEATVWSHIREAAKTSERQNFVFVNVPTVLPGLSSLTTHSQKVTIQTLKFFDSPDKLFLLEIWKWLDPKLRSESLLGDMDHDTLSKVTLVFEYKNKWCMLNLNYLNNWRKETTLQAGERIAQFPAVLVQKLFLKMLVTMQSRAMEEELAVEPTPLDPGDVVEKELSTVDEYQQTDDGDDDDDEDLPSSNRLSRISDKATQAPYVPPQPTQSVTDAVLDDVDANSDAFDLAIADIDKDLEEVERIEKKTLMQRGVKLSSNDDETEQPSVVSKLTTDTTPEEFTVIARSVFEQVPANDMLRRQIDQLADYGLMSAADFRNMVKQSERVKTMPEPYGGEQMIEAFAKVTPEDTKIDREKIAIAPNENVFDKEMLVSTLTAMDSDYIKKVMPKDIVSMVLDIQRSGIIIQKYEVEEDISALGEYENHTLQIKPIDGVSSVVRFRLSKVDDEGSYVSNGNKYRMRKQRGDIPIRKIRADKVSLTSYYGKVFVQRSEKKVYDLYEWLARKINTHANNDKNANITNVNPANVFDNLFPAPRVYSSLSKHFKSFTVAGNTFLFDHKERALLADPRLIETLEEDNGERKRIVVGTTQAGEVIVVDFHNDFFVYRNKTLMPMGNIFAIALIDETQSPVESAELTVYSQTIPVGVILGYKIGIVNLIKLLKVKPVIYEARQRVVADADSWVMVFKDKKLVFSRKDVMATLILGGFNQYKKSISQYFLESFDNKNVYLNVLESQGVSGRYLREIDTMDQLFVDSITRSILVEMKEPTTFMGLLVRSAELLTTDYHPDTQDMNFMRIKGYERFSGAVYKELVKGIKEFKARNIRGKSQIDIPPYAVAKNISQDPSAKLTEDINPLQNLKEAEAITYVGEGGRTKESMDKKTRSYHASDMGVVSEATVDSGDVSVNAFLSANPQFSSLRGMAKQGDKVLGATSLLSTSALLTPGAVHDDPKRVNK